MDAKQAVARIITFGLIFALVGASGATIVMSFAPAPPA